MSLADVILLLTAALIAWYSWETRKLRISTQRNTDTSADLLRQASEGTVVSREQLAEAQAARVAAARPIVTVDPQDSVGFDILIQNVGAGAALNVELRISQVHQTEPGYTNLRNLLEPGAFDFFALAPGARTKAYPDLDLLRAYQESTDGEFRSGYQGAYVLVISYEDVFANPYVTVVACQTWNRGIWAGHTLTVPHAAGELPAFPREKLPRPPDEVRPSEA